METKYFSCDCQSFEHELRFCYDEPSVFKDKEGNIIDIWETVDVDIHLNNKHGFFKRLWIATRYALGFHIGHWEYSEVAIIDRNRLPELISLLEEIRDYKKPEGEK